MVFDFLNISAQMIHWLKKLMKIKLFIEKLAWSRAFSPLILVYPKVSIVDSKMHTYISCYSKFFYFSFISDQKILTIKETEENAIIIENIKDHYKLLKNKYLNSVKNWIKNLTTLAGINLIVKTDHLPTFL